MDDKMLKENREGVWNMSECKYCEINIEQKKHFYKLYLKYYNISQEKEKKIKSLESRMRQIHHHSY